MHLPIPPDRNAILPPAETDQKIARLCSTRVHTSNLVNETLFPESAPRNAAMADISAYHGEAGGSLVTSLVAMVTSLVALVTSLVAMVTSSVTSLVAMVTGMKISHPHFDSFRLRVKLRPPPLTKYGKAVL